MILVYVAGPYTAPTACEVRRNVQAAREVADRLNRRGAGRCFAVTPHLIGAGIEDSGDAQFWYDATLAVMCRCDAVVMLDDWRRSEGATTERKEAQRRGLPVFAQADLCGVEPTPFDAWLAAQG